ncbi:Tonsoku-like protein [Armadillidium nasatum]|uniref:Tonsoku-like protein n=1 Tax=Armadillidium nasatum TaxID=96803 RepID=A0A5N5SLE4_9CRUS|nr:Tonsoku-like protein [Armadillidium nasatum]
MNSISSLRKDKQRAHSKNNLKDVAEFCNILGVKLTEIGDYKSALQEHTEELNLFEALDDSLGVAVAHRKIGEVYSELQKFNKALEHLNKYLSIAIECNDLVEQQRAYATFGRTYMHQAESAFNEKEYHDALCESEKNFLSALRICEKIGENIDPLEMAQMRCRVYHNLGLVLDIKGKTDDALKFVSQSLELCEKFEFLEDSYRSFSELAKMYQKLEKYDKALEQARCSLKFASKLQKKTYIADSYQLLGQIYLSMDDLWTSRKFFYKSYKSFKGEVAKKNLKGVVKLCNVREELSKSEFDNNIRIKYFDKLGDFFASMSLYKQAISSYENMLNLAEKNKNENTVIASIYSSLAQTYQDIRQYDKAFEYFNKELDIQLQSENYKESASTLLEIAKISESIGHSYGKVSSYFDQALEIAKKAKLFKLQSAIIRNYVTLSDIPKSIELELKSQLTEIQSVLDEETELIESDIENESDEDDIDLDCVDFTDSEEDEVATNSRSRRRLTGLKFKKNEKGESPLHVAVIKNNFSTVQNLLKNGHPVNIRDYGGWLPIHEACNFGYRDIAEILIEHGAFVNDRGGSAGSGTTPLHDAATNYHFDVVELLVHNKANVLSKNDNGDTALDCVLKNKLENLTPVDIENLNKTVMFLKEKMERVGFTSSEVTNKVKAFKKKALKYITDIKPNDNIEIPVVHEELNLDENLDDLPDIITQNNKENSATEAYKTAMKSVGSHSRFHENTCSVSSKDISKPSLVPEDEYVLDDWLIDDLGQTRKRKRQLDNFEYKERSKISTSQVFKKKLKQAKLTHMKSPVSHLNNCARKLTEEYESDTEISNEPLQFGADNCNSINEINKSTSHVELHKESPLCIQVKILQNKVIVPVAPSAQNNTISWLEEEVCKRYFQVCGVKRTLKLLTLHNNEELNSEDIISNVITSDKPELKAIITGSREYTSMALLYKGVCQALGLSTLFDVFTILQECESLGVLNFSRIYLRSDEHLKPLLTAIQFQNIHTLNFNSCKLENAGMINLIQSLPSLPLLEKLEAQSCSLSSESFDYLSTYLCKNKSSIKKLFYIDFSYNDFSRVTSLNFFQVLKFELLLELKLSSCDLSLKGCLENGNSNITSLYMDFNSLSTKSLFDIVVFCPRLSFISLHGCILQNENNTSLGSALSIALGYGSYCMLKDVDISNCNVTDEDLDTLSSYIYRCQSINKLNIHNNNKLSSSSVTKLLKELTINLNVPLQTLSMQGISSLENNGTFYSCLSDLIEKKYSSTFPFVSLTLCLSVCSENIKSLWKTMYKERALIKTLSNVLFLKLKTR